jgi:hypothetical protein
MKDETHVCKWPTGCRCSMVGLEPADDCPTHGFPENRCDCGRYISYRLYPVAREAIRAANGNTVSDGETINTQQFTEPSHAD